MSHFFSYKDRPMHHGPYPLELLPRQDSPPALDDVPAMVPLRMRREADPESIVNAMTDYQAMMDATRDGLVKRERAEIPAALRERADHIKSFGYYLDAAIMAAGPVPDSALLADPVINPDVARLAETLRTQPVKTLAAGIDVIMAALRESMAAPPMACDHHGHAVVLLHAHNRAPEPGETGCDWILDAEAERAALRGAEAASILANYLRLLGWEARAHSPSASDVDLGQLAVAAGAAQIRDGRLWHPYLGHEFGITAITTTLDLAHDRPLAPISSADKWRAYGPGWRLGRGQAKTARNRDPFRLRKFADGPHPFETLSRVDTPTTFIDEDRIPRVPKRADMFARALFGDMGPQAQDGAKNGNYVRKSASAFAFRPPLGAMVLLQDGPAAPRESDAAQDPARNAERIKAAAYWLGVDAVGLSRCPDWAYYSHDARGDDLVPYHRNAINMIIDQGHETMEGASGDDWIACAQSMRAYLRFSYLGGVIAQQIRNLGFTARVHSVMDGEVLQPPLLLLSGLGEVSRIGEVILNPFLGPRLKSGTVTTDMPMTHDKPIDFGLQNFCASCNKCARECPSGAITAGPKLMFNGYEIWKSDSQKCTTYRVTVPGGAMCGRCMKTCPWNLEGLFAEKPFRWAAMKFPGAAQHLAALDDRLGHGGMNRAKKWWWDLEMVDDGAYLPARAPVNSRDIDPGLDLRYEDQTLAVYPAPLAPPPWPFPYPMDREAGIAAYRAMIPADDYRRQLAAGEIDRVAHRYTNDRMSGDIPVIKAVLSRAEAMTPDVTKYEFRAADGGPLPEWTAGAHIDVVVAPEFLRQYSLSGNPADHDRYQIAVLREDAGKGGSKLMHRIFAEGRVVFIGRPINHFPLIEDARRTYLMGGGIGVTPMIAMAHRLHALGRDFALHYCCSRRDGAGFLDDLAGFAWADRVQYHFSDENSRADLDGILGDYAPGDHVYTCGPDRFMDGVMAAAEAGGFPEEARHLEYFSMPEVPDYENHAFTLRLAKSGRDIAVSADQAATDALIAAGVHVDVKCSDGLCGVCKCAVRSGDVEHRDFVLSKAQRAGAMILCQSRASEADGIVEIDL